MQLIRTVGNESLKNTPAPEALIATPVLVQSPLPGI